MMSSLKKLRKIAAARNEKKLKKQISVPAKDEIGQATLNMNDMQDCYERLHASSAAMANSVYEFSESLKEMGDCLLEKTALLDDEESGKVLLMLGKTQLELQTFVDGYRSHIFQTITVPADSLLKELHFVEVLKNRCDQKREIYQELKRKTTENRKCNNAKDQSFHSSQLRVAQEEYEEEANAFVFRMKLLKQGQSQSFLTQASRHHAAQLSFFRKAVMSLESIEPHVKSVSEQYHIDYQFIGHKDSRNEIYDDYDDRSEVDDDTEDDSATLDATDSRNSMEVDKNDVVTSPENMHETARGIFRSMLPNQFSVCRDVPAMTKSAPLLQGTEKDTQWRSLPSGKFVSYVLPTPDETRNSISGKLSKEAPQQTKKASNALFSSSADLDKIEKSGPIILTTKSVDNASPSTNKASPSPIPFSEGASVSILLKPLDQDAASYAKKAKIQAFSGPLLGNRLQSIQNLSNNSGFPQFSGPLLHTPLHRPPVDPKLSSFMMSPPKISELHKLPLPPSPGRSPHFIAYSGPLLSRNNDSSTTSALKSSTSAAMNLPLPQALPRSHSIPRRGGHVPVKLHRLPENSKKSAAESVSSHETPPSFLPASPPSLDDDTSSVKKGMQN